MPWKTWIRSIENDTLITNRLIRYSFRKRWHNSWAICINFLKNSMQNIGNGRNGFWWPMKRRKKYNCKDKLKGKINSHKSRKRKRKNKSSLGPNNKKHCKLKSNNNAEMPFLNTPNNKIPHQSTNSRKRKISNPRIESVSRFHLPINLASEEKKENSKQNWILYSER